MNAPLPFNLDILWAELTAGIPKAVGRTSFRFDPAFYKAAYPDWTASGTPERHYETVGLRKKRHPNLYRRLLDKNPDLDERLRETVTEPRLLSALEANVEGAGELAFELMRLDHDLEMRVSDFSTELYRRANRDVRRSGMDPLVHYLYHGLKEGRPSLRTLRQRHWKGRRPFDPGRPTCLIAMHEMSRTGAPIVALDLVREASETMNVIAAGLHAGPLLDSLLEHACDVVATASPLEEFPYLRGEAFEQIESAIVNSFEAFPFVHLLVARDIPFASYLHEYPDYILPAAKTLTIGLYSDIAVFSSEHVRDSWKPRFADMAFDLERDSLVVPQRAPWVGGVTPQRLAESREKLSRLIGRDCRDCRIVVGAGYLQWRKGSDVFVMASQIARAQDPGTIFVWIGDGLDREDWSFGVWFGAHLDRVGANDLSGNLFLIPAGPYYRDVLAAADAMFLSSRLDPLPNVVFDALEEGCQVVFFDGATGFVDERYARTGHLTAVEYSNPAAAAEALLAMPRKAPAAATQAPEPAAIFDRISGALRDRLASQRYFAVGATGGDLTLLYARDQESGRPFRRLEQEKLLRTGRRCFWRDATEAAEALEESDNWVHAACRILPLAEVEAGPVPDFALHLHAFYIDRLGDAIDTHPLIGMARRRVVTTDHEEKAAQIERVFAERGQSVETLVVPNRGRDILPFIQLFGLGGAAGTDPLWCHMHLKKSPAMGKLGEDWRQFLFDILLGDADRPGAAAAVAAREDVGLVTAFDLNYGSWNASRLLLPKFAPRLPGPLPEHIMTFPMGNMFWAKREVAAAMLDLFGPDYPWPSEPIPYDGTEYHLIERLWPAMAASLGLRSVFLDKADQRGTR